MSILEIIKGIQAAMSKSHDGALDDDGKQVKIGLKREKGHPINDSRVIDGFKVHYNSNKIRIIYQAECTLKEMKDPRFENEIEQMFANIVSFLKKEYKKTTNKALNLSDLGEAKIDGHTLNTNRTWIEAEKVYKIGGIKESLEDVPSLKKSLNENLKNWMKRCRNK